VTLRSLRGPLVAGALLMIPAALPAQGAILVAIFGEKVATEKFHFGLRLGMSLAQQEGVPDPSMRIGMNFGMTANIKLSETVTLVPEFAPISNRGTGNYPLRPTGDAELDSLRVDPDKSVLATSYLDVPVLLRVRVAKDWSIGVGPEVSFLMGAKELVRSSVAEGTGLRTDVEDQFPSTSWSAVADVAWTWERAVGAKDLRVHVRYDHGLTDVAAEGVADARFDRVLMFFVELPFIERPPAPPR
jgi:hypothetical protein